MASKLLPDDLKLISHALSLQAACFKRAINAAVSAKDDVLINHYENQYSKCLNLVNRIANMELPL